jgi:hypothetical protein
MGRQPDIRQDLNLKNKLNDFHLLKGNFLNGMIVANLSRTRFIIPGSQVCKQLLPKVDLANMKECMGKIQYCLH